MWGGARSGRWSKAAAGRQPVPVNGRFGAPQVGRASSVRKRTKSGADETEVGAMLDTVVCMIVDLGGEPVDVQKD